MSIVNDKKDVFNEIGALNSITSSIELPTSTNSLSSVNNKGDIGTFLIDILVSLVGSEVLKSTVGKILKEFSIESKGELRLGLKNQLVDFDADDSLPSSFVSAGYTIKAKDIDVYGKYNTDPSSDIGGLIYQSGSNPLNFDRKAYNAIKTPNTDVAYRNILIRYNDSSDTFTFKPLNTTQNRGEFTNQFVDNMHLFDQQSFLTEVLDGIFGTKSRLQNKNQNQILKEKRVNRVLDNIINDNKNLQITDSELRELLDESRQISEGIREVSVGCRLLTSSLSLEDIKELDEINRNGNDPDVTGNAISGTILNSFPVGQNSNKNKNQQTIKDGLLKKIINSIIGIFAGSLTTSPEARVIIGIVSGFRNNNTPQIGDAEQDLINSKELIKCIVKKVKELIFEFLFNLVKEELLKLILPVSKVILKEKINQYISILKTLVSFG